ncbi:hypothetical protein [Asanoa siamensis]|nr:hypothetical protein [Asanoa siamensis]
MTTPGGRPRVGVNVALALLALPLLPIGCLSAVGLLLSMAPSTPCRQPWAEDASDCGAEPVAVLPSAVLSCGYVLLAALLATRTRFPVWFRILALALAPVAAAPLVWALFFYRPYGA